MFTHAKVCSIIVACVLYQCWYILKIIFIIRSLIITCRGLHINPTKHLRRSNMELNIQKLPAKRGLRRTFIVREAKVSFSKFITYTSFYVPHLFIQEMMNKLLWSNIPSLYYASLYSHKITWVDWKLLSSP